MKRRIAVVFLCAFAVVGLGPGGVVWADSYISAPYCQEPREPWGEVDRDDVERYHSSADEYERCFRDFILEQQSQAREHREAADSAQDQLDRFDRAELDLNEDDNGYNQDPFKSRSRW